MKNNRIASRYAKALFDLAAEKNLTERISEDMKTLSDTCSGSREFLLLLKSPVISITHKLRIFKALFFNSLNPLSYFFLEILLKKRRETIIPEIAEEYLFLFLNYNNIKQIKLTTPVTMQEEDIDHIKEILKKQLKSDIFIDAKINPDLLGGFVIRAGDRQFDASVRKNINKLIKEFNINIYKQKF